MKKILIIEDNASIRDSLADLLELSGFAVRGAGDGLAGLQKIKEQIPDLIICDVTMPGLSGYDVLAKLQENEQTSSIPFIFLSARSERADMRHGMEAGADDYVTKPVSSHELLAAISSCFAKRERLSQRYQRTYAQNQETLASHVLGLDHLSEPLTHYSLLEYFKELQEKITTENLNAIAILVLGLTQFERYTARLGLRDSQRLLSEVAQRLQQNVASSDLLVSLKTAHFALISTSDNLPELANNLLRTLKKPVNLNDEEIFLTAQIGIVLYPLHATNLPDAIKHATHALQQAEPNSYKIYVPSRVQAVPFDELKIERELHYAIEREQFELYYQPQVTCENNQIKGVEVLLRWRHPEYGLVSPGIFIPLAEQTGLIHQIGDWVLRTAFAQAYKWQVSQIPVTVGINISARQFMQPFFTQRLKQFLQDYQLDPHYINLELTESSLVQNVTEAAARLGELRGLGFRISIDDFGTGYSSLSYLKQFPFDVLKIDRIFVAGVDTDAHNQVLVDAIIRLAHDLGLEVVAEGVETDPELNYLRQHNCDQLQGYLFSRPIPLGDFENLLSNSN